MSCEQRTTVARKCDAHSAGKHSAGKHSRAQGRLRVSLNTLLYCACTASLALTTNTRLSRTSGGFWHARVAALTRTLAGCRTRRRPLRRQWRQTSSRQSFQVKLLAPHDGAVHCRKRLGEASRASTVTCLRHWRRPLPQRKRTQCAAAQQRSSAGCRRISGASERSNVLRTVRSAAGPTSVQAGTIGVEKNHCRIGPAK
jgi:hypothetical protein